MPENRVIDPFKPAQPRIPGVSAPEENPRPASVLEEAQLPSGFIAQSPGVPPNVSPRFQFPWLALMLAGALSTAFLLFGLKRKTAEVVPAVAAVPASLIGPISTAPAADAGLPLAPGEVATKAQLSKTWSAARFYFLDPVTSKRLPAMVVRLPGGAFWAFSLQEPFGSCELEYVTDLRKLRAAYGFEAAHPMVADPCNGTVFDLTHYGNAPSGLVRGEIEKGPGWRPPIAIEVRTQGDRVIAQRIER
jgi:hypothetical protein